MPMWNIWKTHTRTHTARPRGAAAAGGGGAAAAHARHASIIPPHLVCLNDDDLQVASVLSGW
jgi:hypothetical protein